MDKFRFDIVVFNYKRIESFFNNFNKITHFNKEIDIITIITSSPSINELELVESFKRKYDIKIRYLTRENRGIDQLARIQYFLGELGHIIENTTYKYIFQMQEHYLDTTSHYSIWGKELNYQIKGDVIPDDIVFDLNEIENIFRNFSIHTLFCDRNNPCFFTVRNHNYIAPNGGNFILNTNLLSDSRVIKKIKFLKKTFENNYEWAVFAEFFWGEIFFAEGSKSYDYKRRKCFTSYKKTDFYTAPDNYKFLRSKYANLHKGYVRSVFSPFLGGLKKIKSHLKSIKL